MRHESALKTRGVPVAYRAPFAIGQKPYLDERPPGETILEIVRGVPDLPAAFFKRGAVCINGELVPRELWAYVRPKPPRAELAIAVTLHWPLAGGGGSGSTAKAIGSLVAAFALVVITGGIAGGALAPLLGGLGIGTFAAGSTSALILSGAVGIAGALAISALSPPPTTGSATAAIAGPTSDTNTDQKEAAAAQGNVLDKGGAIPRVVGTRKVYPPLAGEPVVELVGDDEFVEALFVLNGPHALEDIRVDNVAIDGAQDISIEQREGWESDDELTSIRRQGRTLTPQVELSVHKINSASQALLADPGAPTDDLPVWHGVASRNEPDEIWLHLLLPSGISVNGSTATDVGIPFRVRMRLRGASAWTNLPEIHLSGSTLQQLRRAILFKWKAPEPTQPVPASGGFVYANVAPTAQASSTTNPATPTAWLADSYFTGSSGNAYLSNGNEASSKVQNLNLFSNRVEIYLDEATFPKGIYEFQIMRGAAYLRSSFSNTAYTYASAVVDFFYYQSLSAPQIPMARANLADRALVTRLVSIWNDYPVKRKGFAMIALKARNRSLQNVSAQASGYVRDWDGSAWTDWTTTSNPAPHYADLLSGAQNIDPLPADLRDDAGLVAWRSLCTLYNWTCDAVINDTRTQDALTLLASCGYARPYQSDVYGVVVDNDRSSDTPIQIFSRRNAASVRYERAFARVPAGFIVTYRDDSADDDQAQQVIYQRDPAFADSTLLESINYDGLVDADKVARRARFDLDQANSRATFYYLDADVESVVCRRGDLVGLEHDILSDRAGDGYIVSKITSGSPPEITGLVLDAEIQITNIVDMHATADMHAVTDMHDVGITTGIVIRRNDGTLSTHTLSNVTGSSKTLTLASPLDDTAAIEGLADSDGQYGCLVVAGQLSSIYRRLLVQSITAQKDLKATLCLVDEAPELWIDNWITAMDGATRLTEMDGTSGLSVMA